MNNSGSITVRSSDHLHYDVRNTYNATLLLFLTALRTVATASKATITSSNCILSAECICFVSYDSYNNEGELS
jgi:hypothetical protein